MLGLSFLLVGLLAAAIPSTAQPPALVIDAHLGGFVNTFEVQGSTLFAAQADVFKLFDLDQDPLVATAFFVLDGEASALALADGRAHVAVDQRLELVDFDSPGGLMPLGGFDAGAMIQDLAIDGEHALLALGAGGLAIIDLQDPTTPTLAGNFPGDVRGVAARAGQAFLATDGGLVVVDLADPANPSQVGALAAPAQSRALLSGDLAFLFGGSGQGLQIIDVLDPSAPTLAGELAGGDSFSHLAVDSTRLYAVLQGRLVAFDLTDPANVVELGELALPFATDLELDVVADQLVVSASGQLRRVDFSDPAAPAFIDQPESPPFPTDHAQRLGELLVSADDGLWRYDISNPAAPRLSEHQPAFPGSRIRTAGGVLYLLDNAGVLRALETAPDGVTAELDALTLPVELNPVLSFEVDQDLAFVLGFARLQVIDLSNPGDLVLAGHLDLPIPGRDLAVLAGAGLVAVGLTDFSPQGTLALVDVSDPATPGQVGQVTFDGRPDAVTADAVTAGDSTVHVLARSADLAGFHIHRIDATTPASPAVLESVDGAGEPRDLLGIAGDSLLAAFATGGDLSEAANPPGPIHKAAQSAGSVRSFEAGPINQAASQSLPEPASLSTAPSGETPFAVLSGFKLDSSLEVFGSKGFYLLSLLSPQIPELTLGASASPTLDCPPDPGEEVHIAELSLCADLASSWDVISLSLAGRGTGDEELDVEQAILKFPGGPATASFTADNGSVLFSIDKILGAGQCLPMELVYLLTPEGRQCSQEQTKTFAIEVAGADVDATAFNNPPGIKKPFAPIITAAQELACVENETKDIGFPQVQPAIDDDRTDPGDTIGVCPGVFDELIVVNKEDLTLHSKETADVTFLGVEAEIDCEGGNGGAGDRVSIVEDGVRLLDFTITGALNGVVVSGKDAEVFANIIGGNAGDGVRTVGIDLNTEITLNVIGEQQTALNDIPTKRRNGANGINLFPGAGDSAAANFLIGNCQNGLLINGFLHPELGGSANKILGNVIEGNLLDGIHIRNSSMNQIGSSDAADRNLIGGNGGDGIDIQGNAAVGNKILGNRIGTGRNGSANANQQNGIRIHNGAEKTEIGGFSAGDACTGPCNAIEANIKHGIQLGGEDGPITSETKIVGNYIGVTALGLPSDGPIVGNDVGIYSSRASRTSVGDTQDGNLISGNRSHGILVENGNEDLQPTFKDASIARNLIGTTLDGSAVLMDGEQALGNGGAGVLIRGRAVVRLDGNTVSGNNQQNINPEGGGIVILDTQSGPIEGEEAVALVGNLIGTDRAGKKALGNGTAGVWMTRGHSSAVDNNVISGNAKGIVYEETISPPFTRRHQFFSNIIGLDKDKLEKLPNDVGVLLLDSTGIEIASNTISGNREAGIKLQGSNTDVGPESNQIIGNAIGTLLIDPEKDFGNGGAGIQLQFAKGNLIGLDEFLQPDGNLIHFNDIGILFDSQSDGNVVLANEIRQQISHGIEIRASSQNLVGSTADGFFNVISNNGTGAAGTADGVAVTGGEAALGNLILGNEMRGNADLAIDLEDDGPTANDLPPQHIADEDDGANDKQNFPQLISAIQNGNLLNLVGVLQSKPGSFSIQVYESRCPLGGGAPELLRLLTEYDVTVGGNRFASIDQIVALASDTTLGDISVTATGAEGTSEVEPCQDLSTIFSDGFESGDPSAWTDFQGGLP